MLSKAQFKMLKDVDDGEVTDYADYMIRCGNSALAWHNRERVLSALLRKGLLDDDLKITEAGKQYL